MTNTSKPEGEYSSRDLEHDGITFEVVEEEHTPRKPVPCGIQGVLQSTLKNRPADTLIFSWDEICNRFETLELNWNPQLFANMKDLHS